MKKPLKKTAKAKTSKAVAKKASPKSAPKKPALKLVSQPPQKGRGFMWKILELKQREHQERALKNQSHPGDSEDLKDKTGSLARPGFGRFAGPRRRVG